MKKTLFPDGFTFVSRRMYKLAAVTLVAAVLLSVLPLTTPPLRAADPAAGEKEPAAGKVDGQISVILEGTIDGEDEFVFRDDKVFLEHRNCDMPEDVTVNGKPWKYLNEPFKLGFSPDFASTNFVREGRGKGDLTRSENSIRISVVDTAGGAARYRIILFQPSGVKNPLTLPKDSRGETTGWAVARIAKSFDNQKAEPDAKEVEGQISVILEGIIDGKDTFVFHGGKLYLNHTNDYDMPEDVTVNGKPWTDLNEPFELDFMPDPVSTHFVCEGRGSTSLIRSGDGIMISVDDREGAAGPYRIVLFQPSGVTNPLTIPKVPVGKTGTVKSGEKPAERSQVVLSGTIESKGSFTFLENTISYQHDDGEFPTGVTVNGKPWQDLTEQFVLDYDADLASSKVAEKNDRGEASLFRLNDGRTCLLFNALPYAAVRDADGPNKLQFAINIWKTPHSGATKKQPGSTSYINLNGTFKGKDVFTFLGDTVTFRHEDGDYPTEVEIGGRQWINMSEPFKLGYLPIIAPSAVPSIWGERVSAKVVPREDGGTDIVIDARQSASERGRGRETRRIQIPAVKKPFTGEAKPAATRSSASQSQLSTGGTPALENRNIPADGGVVIEGTFNGIGRFVFNGSRIAYRHIAFEPPRDVTVNGVAWPITGGREIYWMSSTGRDQNPDFDLGFIPDYSGMIIAAGQNDPQNLTLTKGDKGMDLYFSELNRAPKRTKIRLDAKKRAASAQSADRAELAIRATDGRGAFSFRKNMIVFIPVDRNDRAWPKNVTVNGKYWSDLSIPFGLDFLPDFGNAEVLEAVGPGYVRAEKKPDNVEMVFDNSSVFNGSPACFTVSMEKRPLPAPDTRYTAKIQAEFQGAAAFKFEGGHIVYYPLFEKPAQCVTVNGKPWDDLDKPFELGFEVEPIRAQLVDKVGNCTVEQMKYPDLYVLRMENKGSGLCVVTAELNGDAPVAMPAATASGAPGTVSIGMKLNGAGRLTFRGNRISYTVFEMNYPSEVTVNGEPWTDLTRPFELDFVPEFSSAKIVSSQSGGTMELTPGEDRAEVYLNAGGSSRTYQFDVAMKKRKDAEPGSAPADTTQNDADAAGNGIGYASFAGTGPFAPAAKPFDDDNEVVFEVTTDKPCVFTFRDDMILCDVPDVPEPKPMGYNEPMITLNGRMIDDLDQPIILNFIPDLEHADVSVSFERRSQITRRAESPVLIRRDGKKLEVSTMDMGKNDNGTFSLKIGMKKLADSGRDPNSGVRLTLDDPKRLKPAGQAQEWGATMQMIVDAMEGGRLRSIDFDAEIAGTGVFEFFGDRIRYRHESGRKPAGVTVGGKAWNDLDEPFEMPFVVDHSRETLSYGFAADSPVAAYPFKPVSLVGDRDRLYLATRTVAATDGGTPGPYHIHYVMTELNLRMGRGRFRISTPSPEQQAIEAYTATLETKNVVLEGVIDANPSFMVEGNAIRYVAGAGREPTRVSVNGNPWTDLSQPFELDFAPEYSAKAKIVESLGRTTPLLNSLSKSVEIKFNDQDSGADLYRLVFALKKKPDGKQ